MTEVRADAVDTMALACVIDALKAAGYDMQRLVNSVNSIALHGAAGSGTEGTGPLYKIAVVKRVSDLCGTSPRAE